MTVDKESVITVHGLKNSFGDQVVHDGLDLEVKRGEIFGVVGGSGTGKSVLMRSIIGLQVPDEGEVIRRAPPRNAGPARGRFSKPRQAGGQRTGMRSAA